MPDGVVQWFDPVSGEASIVRAGRVYAASASELEPVARHPGAHVHFDIRRAKGAERAVAVTLRPGARVSHRHRRYGTLVGARRADTKGSAPFARPHPDRGRALASHPLEVARAWVDRLRARDLDGVLSLYTSDAVVHADGADHVGRAHLASYLEASPMFGIDQEPLIRGDDADVVIRWAGAPSEVALEVRARLAHGLLAEQWVAPPVPSEAAIEVEGGAGAVSVAVATHGQVSDSEVDYAAKRIGTVLRRVDAPILFARLKLSRAGDPAREKPAIAQVAVDVDGGLVRAHVAGHEMREAADLLQRRLADKLEQRAEHREALRKRAPVPEPGEWRHGDRTAAGPAYFDRPVDDRQLVRHKTFAVDELTPDEAAFDMEQLDYDFHLFRDLASGEDAVLQRLPDATYRLTRLHALAVEAGPCAIALTIADGEPAELTVSEALERLDAGHEPFVFFANASTGRGNVVYRRYDGHYGLIVAAGEEG